MVREAAGRRPRRERSRDNEEMTRNGIVRLMPPPRPLFKRPRLDMRMAEDTPVVGLREPIKVEKQCPN